MKDKETKESLEQLIEYFGDTIISDWTSNENGIDEADSLRVKRELIDFVEKLEQEAERRGVEKGIHQVFSDIVDGVLTGVIDDNGRLHKLKLLEEENGKQNAR